MAVVRYASYADILSRLHDPPAFHSVSNGAVNVECPKAKTAGSEKAVEVPSADESAVLQSVQAIIERMLRRLDEWCSAPAFPLLPLPVESPIDEAASAPANLLSPNVAPTSLLQSSPSPPPLPQFTTTLVSSDMASTSLLQSSPSPPPLPQFTTALVSSDMAPTSLLQSSPSPPPLPQFTTALVSSDVAPTPLPLSSTMPLPQPHPVSSLSRVAMVWSMTEVKKVTAPKGRTKRADVAFSPINLPLATTRADKNRSLWDVETGEEFLLQEGHDRSVYGLSFPHDGSLDGFVRFDAQPLNFQGFSTFVHVLKLEYEPPPNKESYLGFNPSLEDKAVSAGRAIDTVA